MVFCEVETTSSNVDMNLDVRYRPVTFTLKTNYHGTVQSGPLSGSPPRRSEDTASEWRSSERF